MSDGDGDEGAVGGGGDGSEGAASIRKDPESPEATGDGDSGAAAGGAATGEGDGARTGDLAFSGAAGVDAAGGRESATGGVAIGSGLRVDVDPGVAGATITSRFTDPGAVTGCDGEVAGAAFVTDGRLSPVLPTGFGSDSNPTSALLRSTGSTGSSVTFGTG